MSYQQVFDLLNRYNKSVIPILIAIDGRCCSGKSTLANKIRENYDCNIIKIDDFFLPKELRTAERMAQVGGNIHFERLYENVILPILYNGKVKYRAYDCQKQTMSEELNFDRKTLNIVEGVYSQHPRLLEIYHARIFLTVDHSTQRIRLLHREGKTKVRTFETSWIPKEEQYFKEFSIESKSDLIIDTTNIDDNRFNKN